MLDQMTVLDWGSRYYSTIGIATSTGGDKSKERERKEKNDVEQFCEKNTNNKV